MAAAVSPEFFLALCGVEQDHIYSKPTWDVIPNICFFADVQKYVCYSSNTFFDNKTSHIVSHTQGPVICTIILDRMCMCISLP